MGTGGGDKRDRTADLLHAMQALSQLSYTPTGLSDWRPTEMRTIPMRFFTVNTSEPSFFLFFAGEGAGRKGVAKVLI